MNSKTFYYINHQEKGRAYVNALIQAGYEQTQFIDEAKFLLADCDAKPYWPRFDLIKDNGGEIFIYPHAARPWVTSDGCLEPYPRITAYLTIAEGHEPIMRACGIKVPIHAVGWPYTALQPFKPSLRIRRVLFCPIHPNGNGWLSDTDKELNSRTYQILVDLHKAGNIELTVRHLKSLPANGLWVTYGVKMILAQPDQTHAEIDAADVVVGSQTIAHTAIARGKPTVMMGEWTAPHEGNKPENLLFVKNWDKYKHLLMYPLDILSERNPLETIQSAAVSDAEIADWRERIIGRDFNGGKCVRIIEYYL